MLRLYVAMCKQHGCDLRLESFRAPRVCQDRAYILVQEAQNLDLELISEEQDLQEVLEKDRAPSRNSKEMKNTGEVAVLQAQVDKATKKAFEISRHVGLRPARLGFQPA